MNTIHNYLESMFSGLPNTPDVIKAKCELGQMMEDRYNELIGDGKSESEAVAGVISEFGNLEDLGDALGIRDLLKKEQQAAGNIRQLSCEEAENYLADRVHFAFLHGLGTFFAMICPSGVILAGTAEHGSRTLMMGGVIFLFGAIAASITLHAFSSLHMGSWRFLKEEPCSMDYAAAEMIDKQRRSFHNRTVLQRTIAILLFCSCYLPLIILHMLDQKSIAVGAGVVILLAMVGLAVLLLTVSGARESGFRKLLGLGGAQSAGTAQEKSAAVYDRPVVRSVMSVFWQTVICLYLILSFLTFSWDVTWIIWPIAVVVNSLVRTVYGVHNKEDLAR